VADESDGSFLALSPTIAVVTNIDREHMDHYRDMEALRDTFVAFINKIPFYGTAILCLDNEEIQGIVPRLKKRYITYGLNPQADLIGTGLKSGRKGVRFEAAYRGRELGEFLVGMPGEHNVLNALAATAVGLELDLPVPVIKEGLIDLGGLGRRFEIKGEAEGVLVMDDYGHHPTEILATLKAAKEAWPERRLVVLFQPHRYTRTQGLYDRFVISFNDADVLLLAPVYSAGEAIIEGVSAQWLAQGIKEHGHKDVTFTPGLDEAVEKLLSIARAGDLVMTLGAGDVYTAGDRFLERLGAGCAD
jgi:UDP-N-acetylmuramate--alanine ligase